MRIHFKEQWYESREKDGRYSPLCFFSLCFFSLCFSFFSLCFFFCCSSFLDRSHFHWRVLNAWEVILLRPRLPLHRRPLPRRARRRDPIRLCLCRICFSSFSFSPAVASSADDIVPAAGPDVI